MQSDFEPVGTSSYPIWKMEEAKARFSELVRHAKNNQPQKITVHGKEAVVVLSASLFEQIAPFLKQPDLYKLFSESPLVSLEIDRPSYAVQVRDVSL
jgi:antitoxin Phd